ncbi:MAG: tetratricopeptide repeat protein [Burkholderiales bacterium]
MSARASRVACVLLAAVCLGNAAAQDRIDVEDLRIRSDAGDRSAMRQLAELYYLGRGGVGQDFGEAARWYERLAKQGDARAQASLGLMYARGYGVPKNLETARRWWSFAAAQNDPGAQYNLGVMYFTGEGAPRDYKQAAHWLDRAAQRGHVQAQHNLGVLYREGKGVERDPQLGYFWIKVAALQGDEVAQASLPAAARDISPEQVSEADGRAGEWMRQKRALPQ